MDEEKGGCMAHVTINEGLAWLKTLKKRHEELLALRNDNAHRERRFYGATADKEIVKEPVYDVKVLDRIVTRVAREIRLLEQALKATNAKTTIDTYDQDDAATASQVGCRTGFALSIPVPTEKSVSRLEPPR
jgi:hypothetical protein